MEVMGLMLGDFVDDYTVRVVDVSFLSLSTPSNLTADKLTNGHVLGEDRYLPCPRAVQVFPSKLSTLFSSRK